LDLNTGALAPRARPEAELGMGAGEVATFRCGGPGYHPGIFLENSYAKSCILLTTTLIGELPRTCISVETTSVPRDKSVLKISTLLPWLHPWLLEPKQ